MPRFRFRDVLSWSTALPGSAILIACLFLPQFRDCHGHEQTPVQSGFAVVMLPVAMLGVLPVAWRLSRSLREVLPALMLSVAVVVLTWLVITIPLAVFLLWSYSRGSRDEGFVATCAALCVLVFIPIFPLLAICSTWLPGAKLTWAGAWLEAVGLFAWAVAAAPTRSARRRS